MIKKILDENIESAICLCFKEMVESTCFRKFKSNYDVALKYYLSMALEYNRENNTDYYGYYIDDCLVGVIELNGNYINQLVVKRDYQHRKIGTRLIEFVLEGLECVEVDAAVGSIPFYEKLGFVHNDVGEEQKKSVKMVKSRKLKFNLV